MKYDGYYSDDVGVCVRYSYIDYWCNSEYLIKFYFDHCKNDYRLNCVVMQYYCLEDGGFLDSKIVRDVEISNVMEVYNG